MCSYILNARSLPDILLNILKEQKEKERQEKERQERIDKEQAK